ncbi:glutamate receptor ionotropic, delta-1-like [Palaemon carinicauda]|uniref:glutamate receptor ionotropic, delta-1-like n=1 Tax=Palaemon carinicauda TaxID=392227 RepID=UPI0035B5A199
MVHTMPQFSTTIAEAIMIPDTMTQFLKFLLSQSPPHQLYLLYDGDYKGLDDLLKSYSSSGTKVAVIEYSDDLEDFVEVLRAPLTGSQVGRRHILLLCSRANVAQVFQKVAAESLENPSNWWIVLTWEEGVAKVILDLVREGSAVLLVQIRKSGQYTFRKSTIRKDGKIRLEDVGSWNPNDAKVRKVSLELFQDLDETYSDFGGRELTVTANNNIPFFGMKEFDNGTYIPDSGIDINFMDALGDALNFTYRVMKPADGKWGGPLPDGTITGMIGEVARRNAHIAICEITVTALRETVIDFTRPYFMESMTLVSAAPAEKNKAFAAFSPFSPMVWLCIVISALAIGPVVSLETWFMRRILGKDTGPHYNLQDSSFNLFRSLVVQNNGLSEDFWAHKFTFLGWYLFCFNVLVLYSGTLTAVLVTPAFEKPIDYLTDLPDAVKQGATVGTVSDSSTEMLFKEAKDGIYKEIWQLFNHKDRSQSFFPGPDEGFDKIISHKVIFVNAQFNSRIRATMRGADKFHMAKQSFYPQGYGLVCFSGTPFMGKFNKMISYMTEGGLIMKWADDQVLKVALGRKLTEEDGEADGGPTPITIRHLQAAFILLALGFLVAALAMGLELLFWKACPVV